MLNIIYVIFWSSYYKCKRTRSIKALLAFSTRVVFRGLRVKSIPFIYDNRSFHIAIKKSSLRFRAAQNHHIKYYFSLYSILVYSHIVLYIIIMHIYCTVYTFFVQQCSDRVNHSSGKPYTIILIPNTYSATITRDAASFILLYTIIYRDAQVSRDRSRFSSAKISTKRGDGHRRYTHIRSQ